MSTKYWVSMFWVLGLPGDPKAYAIFDTRAGALRWILEHGRIGYRVWKD